MVGGCTQERRGCGIFQTGWGASSREVWGPRGRSGANLGVSLSLPAPSPRRPRTRARCSARDCTLSSTCWQVPGITPSRAERSEPPQPPPPPRAPRNPREGATCLKSRSRELGVVGFFFLPLFWQLKNSGRVKEKDHSAGEPGPGVLPPARPVSVPCPSPARPGWVLPARRSASSVVARCHRASPGTGAGGLVEPRHSTEPPTPLCLGPGLSLPLGADPVGGSSLGESRSWEGTRWSLLSL